MQIKTSFAPHQNMIALLYFIQTFSLNTLIYCFRWEHKLLFLKFLVLLVTKKKIAMWAKVKLFAHFFIEDHSEKKKILSKGLEIGEGVILIKSLYHN